MSLYGAMCWVGGWDFCWNGCCRLVACHSGSMHLREWFKQFYNRYFWCCCLFRLVQRLLLDFYTELELFGSAGFRGTYVFGPARFGQCIDWWYSFLLTEIWWYSCHWSLWTVWLVEPSSESFVSRSAGSEKF